MAAGTIGRTSTVNIAPKIRAVDSDFAELVPTSSIGPVPIRTTTTSTENVAITPPPAQTVATWSVMDKFDQGLKNALIDFINTTKEGVKFPSSQKGRQKKLIFYFYGTNADSVKPDEVGTFNLVFSYPPGTDLVTGARPFTTVSASAI